MNTVPINSRPIERAPLSESEVQSEIRLAVGQLPDVRVWRNNVGGGVIVNVSQLIGILTGPGGIKAAVTFLRTLRPLTWGLCVGSSDLLCVVAPRGRLLAIEVKASDWVPAKSGAKFKHEEEQRAWMAIVRTFGGVAGFARSVDEAMRLVEEARR